MRTLERDSDCDGPRRVEGYGWQFRPEADLAAGTTTEYQELHLAERRLIERPVAGALSRVAET